MQRSLSSSIHASDDLEDNSLHLGLSAIAGYYSEKIIHQTLNSSGKRVVVATLLGTIPGALKEVVDYKENGAYSKRDMLLNMTGAFLGALYGNKKQQRLITNINSKNNAFFVEASYRF